MSYNNTINTAHYSSTTVFPFSRQRLTPFIPKLPEVCLRSITHYFYIPYSALCMSGRAAGAKKQNIKALLTNTLKVAATVGSRVTGESPNCLKTIAGA